MSKTGPRTRARTQHGVQRDRDHTVALTASTAVAVVGRLSVGLQRVHFVLELLLVQDPIALPVHLVEHLLVVRDLRLLLRLGVGNLRRASPGARGRQRKSGGESAKRVG
jgi:hypothetical protein